MPPLPRRASLDSPRESEDRRRCSSSARKDPNGGSQPGRLSLIVPRVMQNPRPPSRRPRLRFFLRGLGHLPLVRRHILLRRLGSRGGRRVSACGRRRNLRRSGTASAGLRRRERRPRLGQTHDMPARRHRHRRRRPPQRRGHAARREFHLVPADRPPAVRRERVLIHAAAARLAVPCEPHERIARPAAQRLAERRIGPPRRAVDRPRPAHAPGQRPGEKDRSPSSHRTAPRCARPSSSIDSPNLTTSTVPPPARETPPRPHTKFPPGTHPPRKVARHPPRAPLVYKHSAPEPELPKTAPCRR